MLHLAIPSMSVRGGGRPYTCPGLGDRIHSCLLAFMYGQGHGGEPVTLHLTADKWSGGTNKPESWRSILALFPEGAVTLRVHDVAGQTNKAWLQHVREVEPAAECYYYADTFGMHPAEERFALDISSYISRSPELEPPWHLLPLSARDLHFPLPYVTAQWRGIGGAAARDHRDVPDHIRRDLEAKLKERGIAVRVVGSEAEEPLLRDSLPHVALAMCGALGHIGRDSGPMHLASCYMPYSHLSVYGNAPVSHHVVRWVLNGAKLNECAI